MGLVGLCRTNPLFQQSGMKGFQMSKKSASVLTKRTRIYEQMTPDLQKIARNLQDRQSQVVSLGVLDLWEEGDIVRKVHEAEDCYGAEAVTRLAKYLGWSPSYAY